MEWEAIIIVIGIGIGIDIWEPLVGICYLDEDKGGGDLDERESEPPLDRWYMLDDIVLVIDFLVYSGFFYKNGERGWEAGGAVWGKKVKRKRRRLREWVRKEREWQVRKRKNSKEEEGEREDRGSKGLVGGLISFFISFFFFCISDTIGCWYFIDIGIGIY